MTNRLNLEHIYEENLLDLAQKISFQEFYNCPWDIHNLEEAKVKIKQYEEIINEHLLFDAMDSSNNSTEISFFDLFMNNRESSSVNNEQFSFTANRDPSIIETSRFTESEIPITTHGKEQKIKDTVYSICQSLTWYKNLIEEQIHISDEDEKLASLLELNDHVSVVLTKANMISKKEQETAPTTSEKSSSSSSSSRNTSNAIYSLILSAIHTIRRGTTCDEVGQAVRQLEKLGNISGGKIKLDMVKQMSNAGALQALLSIVTRASEWPDVELDVSKLISVLVTYEDDWLLLQRSSITILTSLSTLQLRTQTRVRSRSYSQTCLRSQFLHQNSRTSNVFLGPPSIESSNDLSSSNDASESEILALVSAAVAKLSLVLSDSLKNNSTINSKPRLSSNPGNGNFLPYHHSANNSPNPNSDYQHILLIIINMIVSITEFSYHQLKFLDKDDITLKLSLPMCLTGIAGANSNINPREFAFSRENSTSSNQSGWNQFFNNYTDEMPSKELMDNFVKLAFGIPSVLDLIKSLSCSNLENPTTHSTCIIDNSSVLTSAAIAYLAEIPSCRISLVENGVFSYIKYWFELTCLMLENMKKICIFVFSPHFLVYLYENNLLINSESIDNPDSSSHGNEQQLPKPAGCCTGSSQMNEHRLLLHFYPRFLQFYMTHMNQCYELLSNVSATIMFLSGGSTHDLGKYSSKSRNKHPGSSSSSRNHRSRHRHNHKSPDYNIGWIDAQMLADGIPDLIIKVILLSQETIPPLHMSLLPSMIKLHLTQTLHQLCIRSQNRSRLHAMGIPILLTMLFQSSAVFISSHVIATTANQTLLFEDMDDEIGKEIIDEDSQDKSNSKGAPKLDKASMIQHHMLGIFLRNIFDFNLKITSLSHINQENEKDSGVPTTQSMKKLSLFQPENTSKGSKTPNKTFNPISTPNHVRRATSAPIQSISNLKTPPSPRSISPRNSSNKLLSLAASNSTSGEKEPNRQEDQNLDLITLISRYCLDTLTFFLNDELSKSRFLPPLAPSQQSSSLQVATSNSQNPSLISTICNQEFINQILTLTSHLVKGSGRLAAIRILSTLAEWKECLPVLYDSSIMEILMHIASEIHSRTSHLNSMLPPSNSNPTMGRRSNSNKRESNAPNGDVYYSSSANGSTGSMANSGNLNVLTNQNPPNIPAHNSSLSPNGSNTLIPNIFHVNTLTMERNISANSTHSSSSASQSTSRHTASMHRVSSLGWISDYYDQFLSKDENDNDIDTNSSVHFEGDEEEIEIEIEETLMGLYTLANLCEGKGECAWKMYQHGFITILLSYLYINEIHIEIHRQVLRCLYSMCRVLVHKSHASLSPSSSSNNNQLNNNGEMKSQRCLVCTHTNTSLCSHLNSNSPFPHLFNPNFLNQSPSHLKKPSAAQIPSYAPSNSSSHANLSHMAGGCYHLIPKENETFGEILTLLCSDRILHSSSVPIQSITLEIISQIIVIIDSELQLGFVENHLSKIVSIMINPKNDRDIRTFAEQILKNLGFVAGIKDFEICGYDYETLKDWYLMLRAMKPQEQAKEIIQTWFVKLFLPDEAFVEQIPEYYPQIIEKIMSTGPFDLIQEVSTILHEEIVSFDVKPGYLHKEPGYSTLTNSNSRSNFPRNFRENFLKILPFCLPKALLSGNVSTIAASLSSTSSSNTPNNASRHRNSFGTPSAPPFETSNPSGEVSSYDWIDHPPISVIKLLDLYYTSKLHQLVLLDLTSLGVCIPVSGNSSLTSTSIANSNPTDEMMFLLPHPHPVYAVLLPSRTYQSFTRVGRVLQRMFEYSPNSNQLYSLSFRDSHYLGDFHTSLLTTLQKCPLIVSLSFISNTQVEEDALLGHVIGNIPASVRFVSVRNTLSPASIQALCILLRTNNAAFRAIEIDEESSTSTSESILISDSETHINKGNGLKREKHLNKGILGLSITHCRLEPSEIENIAELLMPSASLHRSTSFKKGNPSNVQSSSYSGKFTLGVPISPNQYYRGLRYLDLSHCDLNDLQSSQILTAALSGPLEGLELAGNNIHRGTKFIESLKRFTMKKDSLSQSSSPLSLRNSSNNANPMISNSSPLNCRLRYLGLSQNQLLPPCISQILKCFHGQSSVTSLDLSANSLISTKETNMFLQEFLSRNIGLRVLDLSYNELASETYVKLHLGILKNTTLLMMPLIGNRSVNTPTIELIQGKLRENRLLYLSQCQGHGIAFDEDGIFVYPTEDMENRISKMDWEFSMYHYSDDEGLRKSTGSSRSSNVGLDQSSMSPSPPPIIATPSKSSLSPASTLASATLLSEDLLPVAIPVQGFQSLSSNSAKYQGSQVSSDVQSTQTSHIREDQALPSTNLGLSSSTLNISQISASSIQSGPPSLLNTLKRGNSLALSETSSHAISESEVSKEIKEETAKYNLVSNSLFVLFSAPLVGLDFNNKPHPLEVLDYTTEREMLVQVFEEVHRDVAINFSFATTDMLRTILSFGARALHFSGHGLQAGLCFEDKYSGLHILDSNALKELLSAGGLALDFVFVSACYSREFGKAFVHAGVPHVVCVQVDSKIQDSAAISFTRGFYIALLSGRSVKASFHIAKEALKASPYVPNSELEGEKFVLLPEDGDHDSPIFPNRSLVTGDWPPTPAHCAVGVMKTPLSTFVRRNNHLPAIPADFEGRELEMNTIIRLFTQSRRRLVSLVGEDGVGKSTVASAICKYLADREIFSDSILYIKLKNVRSFGVLLDLLQQQILQFASDPIRSKLQSLLHSRDAVNHLSYINLSNSGPGDEHVWQEEIICEALQSAHMLLVFDRIDDLLCDYGDAVGHLRFFLTQLFEKCHFVKVMNVSSNTLGTYNINVGLGSVIEHTVSLGPLPLQNTLRLFARLTPSLSTTREIMEFIQALTLPRQMHVSVHSRDATSAALQILRLFGDGHPAQLVHLAYTCNAEKVEELKKIGLRIVKSGMPDFQHGHAI